MTPEHLLKLVKAVVEHQHQQEKTDKALKKAFKEWTQLAAEGKPAWDYHESQQRNEEQRRERELQRAVQMAQQAAGIGGGGGFGGAGGHGFGR